VKFLQPFVGVLASVAAAISFAQSPTGGFYGGVTLKEGSETTTTQYGRLPSSWATSSTPALDEGQRTLLFGGYRWRNDVSIEASFDAREALSLTRSAPGVGLALAEPSFRAWNVDVYTSWEMRPSLALYGRLGYGQAESRSALVSPASETRATREGMNYGVGLRFDLTRSLGLRMEYSRFDRQNAASSAGDFSGGGLPESDQLSIGVQFRF
jgi:opacity protein-like surface antigen